MVNCAYSFFQKQTFLAAEYTSEAKFIPPQRIMLGCMSTVYMLYEKRRGGFHIRPFFTNSHKNVGDVFPSRLTTLFFYNIDVQNAQLLKRCRLKTLGASLLAFIHREKFIFIGKKLAQFTFFRFNGLISHIRFTFLCELRFLFVRFSA